MHNNKFDTQHCLYTDEIIERATTEVNRENLTKVYNALCEKGYNPISQLVGYLLTEDPTYITSHNGARILASKMDRDDILVMLLTEFLEKK